MEEYIVMYVTAGGHVQLMLVPLEKGVMFSLLLICLGTQQCIAASNPNGREPRPSMQHEPQFDFNSLNSQHNFVHNSFPSDRDSHFPKNPSGPNRFPSTWESNFPERPSGPNRFPSARESNFPQNPSRHNMFPSSRELNFPEHPSGHNSFPSAWEESNSPEHPSFQMPDFMSEQFPPPQFQPGNMPTFAPFQPRPLPKLVPFQPRGLPTFAPFQQRDLPTLAPIVNKLQPSPTLPPSPPSNQDTKRFLEQSEILRQSIHIETDSKYPNNKKDPLTPPPLPPLQDHVNICENFNGVDMDIPSQLSHLFNTFVRSNVSSDDEGLSFYGAMFGAPEKKEVIGIEPECSQGRCWCPLLHYYDSAIDRCLHQNSVQDCSESEFKCIDGSQCVAGHMRCDGFMNCLDGTDEKDCSQHACSSTQFQCGDGICVDSAGSICNSVLDCLDGSDEDKELCNIESKTCTENQFMCRDKKGCIYKDWQCDGFPDCFDASDELDCSLNCSANQFQCADERTCIDKWRECDFNYDCPDASDEKSCSFCRLSEYRCINSSSVKCVPMDSLCDYKKDCDDGSDEFDCRGRLNHGIIEGSGNVYIDKLLKIFNDVLTRNIPNDHKIREFASALFAKEAPGSEFSECSLRMVDKPFQRVDDSWIHLEYKTLTWTSKLATSSINIKCKGTYKLNDILHPEIIAGITTEGLKININANMKLGLCFKPELEDIKIQGKVKPIIKLDGMWDYLGSFAGGAMFMAGKDDLIEENIEAVKRTILENIEKLQKDGPEKLKKMVKDIGWEFCLGDSLDYLGKITSVALHDWMKKQNLH